MSDYRWIVPTALISAVISYAMLRPSTFACMATPTRTQQSPPARSD